LLKGLQLSRVDPLASPEGFVVVFQLASSILHKPFQF